ncbi:MAG: tetratricopeptide repeat protein, partial [Pirellulales bacterium]|nr:tetratricopeptide repeat protein [Pirellulales bacterium]
LNHLGLCLAAHGILDQAAAALEEATRLEPQKTVYRNNLAAVLVEMGNHRAAFGQLRAVQDEATAYYNLGYLLQKQGDSNAALKHFAVALRRNPDMKEARIWVEHLRKTDPVAESVTPQIARRPNVRDKARRPSAAPGSRSRATEPEKPERTDAVPSTNSRGWTLDSSDQTQNPRTVIVPPPSSRPALHQPAPTSEPVSPSNPSRFTLPKAAPGAGAPMPANSYYQAVEPRSPVYCSGETIPVSPKTQTSPPAVAQPRVPLPQKPPVLTERRWESFFDQPSQQRTDASAPEPQPTPLPTTQVRGTRNTNVVYPLPPVEPLGRGSR